MLHIFLNFFSLLLIFLTAPVQGQDVSEVAGSWSGYIDVDGQNLSINVTFSYSDDILDGTIDIPDQGVFTLPVEVLDSTEKKLVFQFQTGNGPAIFYGERNNQNDRIEGELRQSDQMHAFRLTRNTLTDGLFTGVPESEVIISANGYQIAGSLIVRQERSPLVILVSGSGAQNRNQEIGGFKIFQQLSLQLYKDGYSTFRYDDRGVGKSTGNLDVTLNEMKSDLVLLIDSLKSDYSDRISEIVLLGHNQGGLVAAMAAKETTVDGLVLAAAPFQEAEKIISDQIRKISEVREISDDVVQQNLAFQSKVYDAIREDSGWAEIESELADRLESQIKELPLEHQNALGDMSEFIESQVDRQLETAKTRWFKSWVEINPHNVFSGVEVPMLAVFGEKDTQVLPTSNRVKADSLAKSEDLPLRSMVISGANHLFQEANTGMPMEYGLLEQEFADEFMILIDQFLDSIESTEPG